MLGEARWPEGRPRLVGHGPHLPGCDSADRWRVECKNDHVLPRIHQLRNRCPTPARTLRNDWAETPARTSAPPAARPSVTKQTRHATSKRSVTMPKDGESNVLVDGSITCPPSNNPAKARSDSGRTSWCGDSEMLVNEGLPEQRPAGNWGASPCRVEASVPGCPCCASAW
jgi:hypothetical protein